MSAKDLRQVFESTKGSKKEYHIDARTRFLLTASRVVSLHRHGQYNTAVVFTLTSFGLVLFSFLIPITYITVTLLFLSSLAWSSLGKTLDTALSTPAPATQPEQQLTNCLQ